MKISTKRFLKALDDFISIAFFIFMFIIIFPQMISASDDAIVLGGVLGMGAMLISYWFMYRKAIKKWLNNLI